MEAKSNKRSVRIPPTHGRYVTQEGVKLKFPVLMSNVPRISGKHTGGDEAFLAPNKGKLLKLAVAWQG